MQEKPIRFGTGGWRAVIGSDFIESNIRRTAEGICALMCEEGRTDKPVIIGYDHRFLSETAALDCRGSGGTRGAGHVPAPFRADPADYAHGSAAGTALRH